MTVRACDVCGTQYEAKRPSSKYCSERCRKRAQRSPQGPVTVVPFTPPTPHAGAITATTVRELEAAEMLDSSLGQKALMLAMRLDSVTADTGSSLAAVSRAHDEMMQRALELGKVEADPLDELATRRRERRARA